MLVRGDHTLQGEQGSMLATACLKQMVSVFQLSYLSTGMWSL
jgi:hypothetical protein